MKKEHKNIRVIATKITGPLHCQKKVPCQDFYHYACRGNKLIAVVSDGAGSAKFGKIGAKIICETLVTMLMNTPLKHAQDNIKKAIETARNKLIIHRLNKSKSEQEIINFSATVLGVIYHKNEGLFFHIGDGAGIAIFDDTHQTYSISRPANGSFSCETFFYTMPKWEKYLRFTQIKKATSLFLMTDGVTSFALNQDTHLLNEGFIPPIHRYLKQEQNKTKAIKALQNTLKNKQAQKLNSDDKTFLWAGL